MPIPNPDQVNLHRVNLVFDPLLPFFVLFFKTMFVSFFNLRIIFYPVCDLGTHLKLSATRAPSARRGEEKNKALFFSSPRLALRALVAFRAKYRVRPAWLIKRLSCRLQSLGIPTVPYSELTSEWCHGRCSIIAS